ncbi:hypothetical protein BH10PSE18_BH10PSE18_05580 [soil metagenome]
MSSASSPRRASATTSPADDADPSADGYGSTEPEDSAELEEETGLDLTDASDLDADNVPADEEHDRVKHAPD